MVLDILCLVYDLIEELLLLIKQDIPFQKIVGRDEHIDLLIRSNDILAFLLISGDQGNSQFRREPLKFLSPIENQRGRRHHQGGSFLSLLLCRKQHCDHLQRLAQPHIVGQDPPELPCFQCPKPFEPVFLVFTHDSGQAFRFLEICVLHRLKALDHLSEMAVPLAVHAVVFLQHFIQIKGTVHGQMHFSLHKFLWFEMHGIHHLRKHLQRGIVQVHERAVLETVIFFLCPVACQDIQQLGLGDILCRNAQVQKPG